MLPQLNLHIISCSVTAGREKSASLDGSHKHPRSWVSLALIVLTLLLGPSPSNLPTSRAMYCMIFPRPESYSCLWNHEQGQRHHHRSSSTETTSVARAEFTSGICISHITKCLGSYSYWCLSHVSMIQSCLELWFSWSSHFFLKDGCPSYSYHVCLDIASLLCPISITLPLLAVRWLGKWGQMRRGVGMVLSYPAHCRPCQPLDMQMWS